MAYSDDILALQTYLSGNVVLDSTSDQVVVLYRLLLQITEVLNKVTIITSATTNLDTNKATSGNQTTQINRLTEIDNAVDQLVLDLASVTTNTQDISTELQTGSIKTVVDDLLLELQDGLIKLNTDSYVTQLTTIADSLNVVQNKLYGLHPTDGINASIINLLTDIRNKLVVELVDKPTELKLVLTDQILVSNPVIRTVPLYTPNVAYSIVLPVGTRRFSIKSRLDTGNGDANGIIRYAYIPGIVENATPIGDDTYYTVGQYVEDSEENLVLTEPLTIYFASDTPDVVVSVKYWGESTLQTSSPRTAPHLKHLDLVNIDTEYVYQIPTGTKKFTIKSRENTNDNNGIVRIAYQTGIVANAIPVDGNSYTTIQPGIELEESNVVLETPLNVYLATDTANLPLTIEYWQ